MTTHDAPGPRARVLVAACLAATIASAGPLSVSAQEQPSAIEEIIITGSYIRRDSFDSVSPLTVVDQAAIADNATPNLGEVMASQTFNYGSDFQTNTYAARGQGGVNTQANLRGLGPRATLQLIDGRRTVNTNLNNAIPQIAIQRIDILKDGASALYGTDAVAGVVNIIPDKRFNGTRFSAFHTQAHDSDHYENVLEAMIGTDTGSGNVVFAGAYLKRTVLEQTDRPDFLRQGFSRSGVGNPGTWLVPTRDAAGNLVLNADGDPVMATRPDPGCGVPISGAPTDIGVKGNNPTGQIVGGACALQFGEFWNFINPQEQWSLWSNFTHDFSPNLSNELSLTASRITTDSRGTPQNPGGRTEEFPVVLGDHPGNPFRARNADGQLLFAQDDGTGNPLRDANGHVVVAGTDPSSGVPFNEDVRVAELRIFGKIGAIPSHYNRDRSNTGNATFDSTNYAIDNTIRYLIPDTSWEVMGSAGYHSNHLVFEQKNTSQQALVAGLQGQLKTSPTAETTTYWNPFASQALNCVDGVCTEGTPTFANTQAVVDAIDIQAQDVTNTTFWYTQLIGTGDLFELPNGTLAAAFGAGFRKTHVDVDLNEARNRCDFHEGGCGFDYTASENVTSVFGELMIPVLDNLEVQLAGRWENYNGGIGSSFDPKIGVLFQPLPILSLRASWSSAFVAPTLANRFQPQSCGLQTVSDPIGQDDTQSFRVACTNPNPNLSPETATVWNVGLSMSLFDGDLNFGVDYAQYDFEDRISTPAINAILTRDLNNFLAAGLDLDSAADRTAWINGPNSDPNIVRDPATQLIARVITQPINAQEMKHVAWDFYARYNVPYERFGNFSLNVTGTYVDEYSYRLGEGLPTADGAGRQNESVAEVPPIPRWRVNTTLNWFLGGHSAMARVRWIDEFDIDFNSAALQNAHVNVFGRGTKIDSIAYVDLNYGYRMPNLFGIGRETLLEVGVRNVLDEFPDVLFNLGGIESFVHDIRGRTWYLRLVQDL
jgi:iron complex outermembrane recepter protein